MVDRLPSILVSYVYQYNWTTPKLLLCSCAFISLNLVYVSRRTTAKCAVLSSEKCCVLPTGYKFQTAISQRLSRCHLDLQRTAETHVIPAASAYRYTPTAIFQRSSRARLDLNGTAEAHVPLAAIHSNGYIATAITVSPRARRGRSQGERAAPSWRSWARTTATAGCGPLLPGRCRPPCGSHRSGASPETTTI